MDKLEEILCEVFRLKKDELNDSLTMTEVEYWDSLTHMDLITSIEEAFDIQLSMDEIMDMKDIASIKTIVLKK